MNVELYKSTFDYDIILTTNMFIGEDFMDIQHLNYLLELDRCRSISQASEYLYLSTQQLSRILRAIEEEYHIKIFERTNLGLKPTLQGTNFIHEAEKIVKQNEHLHKMGYLEDNDKLLSGTLSIYSSPKVWDHEKKCIGKFAQKYPNIRIEHQIESGTKILQQIKERPNSVGMYSYFCESDDDMGQVPLREECTTFRLSELRLALYCSLHHPLARRNRSISLKELADEEIILYKPYYEDDYNIQQIFVKINQNLPNIKYVISDKSLFFSLLQETGCVFIGGHMPDTKREEQLYCAPIKEALVSRHDLLVYHSWQDSPIVKAFCEVALTYYDGLF